MSEFSGASSTVNRRFRMTELPVISVPPLACPEVEVVGSSTGDPLFPVKNPLTPEMLPSAWRQLALRNPCNWLVPKTGTASGRIVRVASNFPIAKAPGRCLFSQEPYRCPVKIAVSSPETCFPAERRREHQGYRILVAGIGNNFLGDDAFGGEVIRHLLDHYEIPKAVSVQDFGMRAADLARAIGRASEAVILIDAAPRGNAPGTSYLLELDDESPAAANARINADAESLDPVSVLRLVHELSRSEPEPRLYLVGCEPAVLERDESAVRLSPAVAAAVPCAAEMVRSYLGRYFGVHLGKSSGSTADDRVAS
jgi:hydrogenase maturation protease